MVKVQILLVLFFLFAIFKVVGRYRVGELSLRGMVAWVFFWLVAIFVALVPNSTSVVALQLGIGRGADLAVYAALALLFFLVFRLMVKIEKQNREITKLVRDNALKNK